MRIRQEKESDYEAVRALVRSAFATTAFSDGTEADYLDQIRKRPGFIPALSLVAVENGSIVGQIVLYQTKIVCEDSEVTQLVLSPLSVLPSHFGRGIGRRLVSAACRRARAMGYQAVFLCGDHDYYAKLGFVPSCRYGIFHVRDRDRNASWCMVRALTPGYLESVRGYVGIE